MTEFEGHNIISRKQYTSHEGGVVHVVWRFDRLGQPRSAATAVVLLTGVVNSGSRRSDRTWSEWHLFRSGRQDPSNGQQRDMRWSERMSNFHRNAGYKLALFSRDSIGESAY